MKRLLSLTTVILCSSLALAPKAMAGDAAVSTCGADVGQRLMNASETLISGLSALKTQIGSILNPRADNRLKGAVSARVDLMPYWSESGRTIVSGGIGVAGSRDVRGLVTFYDADGHQTVSACPVRISNLSQGFVAMIQAEPLMDRDIRLNNLEGQSADSILGTYLGANVGAALMGGGTFTTASNLHGVQILELGGGLGLGVNFSSTAVKLERDTEHDHLYPACPWNLK